MTRSEYIQAVKVKLEEISPFDEPTSFIAAGDDAQNTVKPIISYIENTLDEAARNCLNSLPLSLLHADISKQKSTDSTTAGQIIMRIDSNGVGVFTIPVSVRLVRFRHPILRRDITAFITTEDALYMLQENPHTRSGIAKPIAVWSSSVSTTELDIAGTPTISIGQVEIYSFPKSLYRTTNTTSILLGIDTEKTAGSDTINPVQSPIEDYIVLECAAIVADVLGNAAVAQILRQQIQTKLQFILQ